MHYSAQHRQVQTPPLGSKKTVSLRFGDDQPFQMSAISGSTAINSDISPPLSPPCKPMVKKVADFSDTASSPGVVSPILSPIRAKSKTFSVDKPDPLQMLFLNSLGEPKASAISKHDLLSAVAFDATGDILSVGDRGGRVILFERIQNENGQTDFDYLTEFQAQAKGFDVLHSQDVPECVQSIEWLNSNRSSKPLLLAAAARNVKLFTVKSQKNERHITAAKLLEKGKGLLMPKTKSGGSQKAGKHMKTFKSSKEDRIHSISVSADSETFIASDERRIDMWNVEAAEDPVFNLVDIEQRSEVERITSATFNKNSGSIFLYTTSTGKINVCDLRERSDFHSAGPSVLFDNTKNNGLRNSIYSKWTNSISDAQFVPFSSNVISRDLTSVKLWDLRVSGKNANSLYSAPVADYIDTNLPLLDENDQLNDQFFIKCSPDGKHIATGGYNRAGHVLDINATSNQTIHCVFKQERDAVSGKLKVYNKQKRFISSTPENAKIEFKKRVQLGCWANQSRMAPGDQTLALVFRNCIYLYHSQAKGSHRQLKLGR